MQSNRLHCNRSWFVNSNQALHLCMHGLKHFVFGSCLDGALKHFGSERCNCESSIRIQQPHQQTNVGLASSRCRKSKTFFETNALCRCDVNHVTYVCDSYRLSVEDPDMGGISIAAL